MPLRLGISHAGGLCKSSRGVCFSTTRRAARMPPQRQTSICGPVHRKRPPPQTVEASIFCLIPSTTYQHMRPLLRKEPVSIYLHTCFGAATQEGFSIDSTRTASQLPRLSVSFQKYVLAPSSSLLIFFYSNHNFRFCQQFFSVL